MTEGSFFAEDIFVGQFAIDDDSVVSFDPEAGEREFIAGSLDGWARAILTDMNVLTGYPLAHEWEVVSGVLPRGERLVSKISFVFGGAFTVDNFYAMNDANSIRLRGDIACQLRDLPESAQIQLDVE